MEMASLTIAQAREMANEACIACGASEAMANSLVEATLSAELCGRREVGFAHLPDYLDSLRQGRIDGRALPVITRPLPAFIQADAKCGIAQIGFDLAFDDLATCTRQFGIAMFSQASSYTAGEIGYYVRRLAQAGLVSAAFANAHAMVAAAPGVQPAYGTNPLAFGAPLPQPDPPIVFDQSTSATAFVNIARAAAEGRSIPEGWAVDAEGKPTSDPAQAVLGALLPAGGFKGANLALMVEIMSAGISGGSWSLDAGHFRKGSRSPNIGLTVIAIVPDAVQPGFAARLAGEVRRLDAMGVHIPGRTARLAPGENEMIEIEATVVAAIEAFTN